MASKSMWRITVYPPYDPKGDSDDGPTVDGLIELTQDEAKVLGRRLTALDESHEGYIGSYELYDYEAPAPITEAGVLAYILGDFNEDAKRELMEVWKDPASVFDGTEVI